MDLPTPMLWHDSQYAGSPCKTTSLALLVLLLVGCTSSWKAPLEVRDQRPASQPQYNTITGTSYKVRKGDTLYSIAWRSGKDFKQLASWNRIPSPYTIYPGQTLRVAAPPVTRSSASTAKKTPKPTASNTHGKKSASKPSKQADDNKPIKSASRSRPASTGTGVLRWAWPTEGKLVTSFAANDHTRQGVKITGKEGQSIMAAEKGRVVYSGSGLVGYGRLIIIKHNDKYLSAYGHNRRLLVKEGSQVAKGQHIAEMGRSNDGKPILHFEIRRVGKPVDPLRLLPRQ